jgi:hypothetical protein
MAVYSYLYQRITLPAKPLADDRRRLGNKSIADDSLGGRFWLPGIIRLQSPE